jgi:hypothetical protein
MRSVSGIQKYSFHQTGICRKAFTSQHGTPPGLNNRALYEWRRTPTPATGVRLYTRAAWLAIPTDYLSRPREGGISKQISWLPAAPSGQATLIEFAYTRETEADVREAFDRCGTRSLVGFHTLDGGESFFTAFYHQTWINKDFVSPAAGASKLPTLLFSARDPLDLGRPYRIVISRKPADNGAALIEEYGGYALDNATIDIPHRQFLRSPL